MGACSNRTRYTWILDVSKASIRRNPVTVRADQISLWAGALSKQIRCKREPENCINENYSQ